jgi:hypothetical protein
MATMKPLLGDSKRQSRENLIGVWADACEASARAQAATAAIRRERIDVSL